LLFLHSTRQLSSSTNILTSSDRAHAPSILVQEIVMKRREFLKLCVGSTAAAALPSRANGEAGLKEIRIGTQKGGFFPAVRKRHTVEDAFKPLYVERKWIDFQFDPPLLEAVNVGSVDFGYAGDSPPIFAQAPGARIRYAAAVKVEREYAGDHRAV
jgi:sulfonate transport system substrate-binding protein